MTQPHRLIRRSRHLGPTQSKPESGSGGGGEGSMRPLFTHWGRGNSTVLVGTQSLRVQMLVSIILLTLICMFRRYDTNTKQKTWSLLFASFGVSRRLFLRRILVHYEQINRSVNCYTCIGPRRYLQWSLFQLDHVCKLVVFLCVCDMLMCD